MDENVSGQWSNVETQYQRRADLIPNLVNTVKGYASHEKETLEGVVEARSKATQMTVDANDLTPEKLAEYQKHRARLLPLSASCSPLPKLSRPESQPELPGAPSPVGRYGKPHQRGTYQLQQCGEEIQYGNPPFPQNILAGLFGFEKRAYFEAAEGSEQAPKVEF